MTTSGSVHTSSLEHVRVLVVMVGDGDSLRVRGSVLGEHTVAGRLSGIVNWRLELESDLFCF